MKKLKTIDSSSKGFNLIVFAVYCLISALAYFKTQGAGMIFDFNSWLSLYENGTYADVLNSFGYPGLHQMEQFLFFSLFKLFAYNHFAWYLSFALFHAIAAFVSYIFVHLFVQTLGFKKAKEIALLTSFLFLISPLAADTVVNKVTVHYFSSFIFMMLAFYFEIKYYLSKEIRYFLWILVLFIAALFSLEIAYIFPLMFASIWWALLYFNDEFSFKKFIKSPIVFPFVLLLMFLVLHKVYLGAVVGHYGEDVHTRFEIAELFSNTIRYFSSYFLFFDNWSYQYKSFASELLFQNAFWFIALILFFVAILFYFLRKNYFKQLLFAILVLVLALLALAPIANLYYAYMFPIENDRYGYFASIFMYLFVVFALFQLKWSMLRNAILTAFMLGNIFFLIQHINTFSKSSQLAWNLLNDFKWFDDEVVLLVDPQCFGGAKMFGTENEISSFAESLLLHTGIDRREHIHLVAQMNFNKLTDSVEVSKLSDTNYNVELAQWGNWFWYYGKGASSYENEKFKFELHKKGKMNYDLTLKTPVQNVRLLYIANGTWQEVQ